MYNSLCVTSVSPIAGRGSTGRAVVPPTHCLLLLNRETPLSETVDWCAVPISELVSGGHLQGARHAIWPFVSADSFTL